MLFVFLSELRTIASSRRPQCAEDRAKKFCLILCFCWQKERWMRARLQAKVCYVMCVCVCESLWVCWWGYIILLSVCCWGNLLLAYCASHCQESGFDGNARSNYACSALVKRRKLVLVWSLVSVFLSFTHTHMHTHTHTHVHCKLVYWQVLLMQSIVAHTEWILLRKPEREKKHNRIGGVCIAHWSSIAHGTAECHLFSCRG